MGEFRYERDMQEPVINWLQAQGFTCTRELCSLSYNPIDIVAGRFAERVGRRIPALLEAIAVELKLDDVGGVLAQATRNRGSVEKSYAAMPASRCAKLRSQSLAAFTCEGVGLLSVRPDGLDVMIPAQPSITDGRIYKNLWRKCRTESARPTLYVRCAVCGKRRHCTEDELALWKNSGYPTHCSQPMNF